VKAVLALALVVLPLLPARAQLRTVPVPAGAEVVIPPRSAGTIAMPRSTTRARPAEADAWPEDNLAGPSAWTYVLVPLAAGAVAALATNLPGGGGGGGGSSGPVRTR
jgi:hypothetical protein